jgi:hypothetical protein
MPGNVESLLQRINDLSFFQRLFSWKQVRSLSAAAAQEYGEMRAKVDNADKKVVELDQRLRMQEDVIRRGNDEVLAAKAEAQKASIEAERKANELRDAGQALASAKAKAEADFLEIRRLNADISAAKTNEDVAKANALEAIKKRTEAAAALDTERIERQRQVLELTMRLDQLKQESEARQTELSASKELLAAENAKQEERLAKYQEGVAQLNSLKETLDQERQRHYEERLQEQKEAMEREKETWRRHEAEVEQDVRLLCQRNSLEYVEKSKVPFPGAPDNAIRAFDQYIIFDAKSPQGEDLSNFPLYVKQQAEKSSKYLADDVMKDVFLVVPNSTLPCLVETTLSFPSHRVYVISLDSLEPMLRMLARLNEYHFAEGLSPEDEEDICRSLGRMAHILKRRVQVDAFFSDIALKAIVDCGQLPTKVSARVEEVEKGEKLNPPEEKRVKAIATKALEKEAKRQRNDCQELELDPKDVGRALDGD